MRRSKSGLLGGCLGKASCPDWEGKDPAMQPVKGKQSGPRNCRESLWCWREVGGRGRGGAGQCYWVGPYRRSPESQDHLQARVLMGLECGFYLEGNGNILEEDS